MGYTKRSKSDASTSNPDKTVSASQPARGRVRVGGYRAPTRGDLPTRRCAATSPARGEVRNQHDRVSVNPEAFDRGAGAGRVHPDVELPAVRAGVEAVNQFLHFRRPELPPTGRTK